MFLCILCSFSVLAQPYNDKFFEGTVNRFNAVDRGKIEQSILKVVFRHEADSNENYQSMLLWISKSINL